jgi:aspartyl aminopeptidase
MPDPAVVRAEGEALCAFLDAAPSPYHAVQVLADRLRAAGWTQLPEQGAWHNEGGGHFVVRGGSLVAWWNPGGVPRTLRLVGAHTDSPTLRIKPQPDKGRAGYRQLGVEVYGGVLLNSWLDRDLGVAGRVALRDAEAAAPATELVHIDRPVLRIPQLAIHLDREVNERGLVLNRQHHLDPIWGTGTTDTGGFARFLEHELGVNAGDVLAWDVMAYDLAPAQLVGADESLLSGGRIDNLLSCHAAISALLRATEGGVAHPDVMPVAALFDHEEVGSVSSTGADSSMLESILRRLASGWSAHDALERALASSLMVSADGAHATNPNYADRHDHEHQVAVNVGPVLKHNVNERYATSAETAGEVALLAEQAGVTLQHFTVRSDIPCGSTIGPLAAARLGVRTADVGAAQLSMHAARELTGASDPGLLAELLLAHLQATH